MPEDITSEHVWVFVILVAFAVAASYFMFRWIFAVDKTVKQNDGIIKLLSKIAEKQGVTQEEIHSATH